MGHDYSSKESAEPVPHDDSSDSDSLKYIQEIGGNTSKATYQEASGAPVEVNSPLGYSVGWVTVIFLNLSKMIGTGVFSTRVYLQKQRQSRDSPDIQYSIECCQGSRFCRSRIVLLGHWVLDGIQFSVCLHGVCIVLP